MARLFDSWQGPAAHATRVRVAMVGASLLATVPPILQLYGARFFGPYPLFPLLPIAILLAALAASGDLRRILMMAALWGLLVVAAFYVALTLDASPMVGVFPLAVLAGTAVVRRFPLAAVAIVFAVTGAFGTMAAYVPSLKHGVIVDFLLLCLWVAAISVLARTGTRERAWIWPGVAVISAYLAVTVVFAALAGDTDAALRSFRSSGWYALAFLLMAYAPWPPNMMRNVGRVVVAVALVVGAYATLRWQIGPSVKEQTLASATTYTNFVDGKLGLVGSFTSRKELAAWTALVMPFLAVYTLAVPGPWRIASALATGFCAIAVFATEVRIGLVAAVAGVVIAVALLQLARGVPGARLGAGFAAVLAFGALGVGAFGVTSSGDQESTARLQNILTPERDQSVQGRLYKWRTAVREIDKRPLGYGVGSAGLAQTRESRFVNTASLDLDNGYLKVAYEQGFAAMVLYILALAVLLGGLALRVLTSGDRQAAAFGAGGCGALVGLLVLMSAGIYQEGLPALAAWMIVGLGVSQFARVPAPERAPAYPPPLFERGAAPRPAPAA